MADINEIIDGLRFRQELKKSGSAPSEEVRIGKRNPHDGTYETRRANGNIERGILASNGGTTTNQIVRGIQSDGNLWGLDWRNIAQPRRTPPSTPVKYNFVAVCGVYNDSYSEIKKWVVAGGAKTTQITPAIIAEFGVTPFSYFFIENLGNGFLVTFNKFNSYDSSKTLIMKSKGSNLRAEATFADYPLPNEPRLFRYHKYGYSMISVNAMPISGVSLETTGINYFPAPIKEFILNPALTKITAKSINYDFNPLVYFNNSEVPALSTNLQNQWNGINFDEYANPFAENETTFYNLLVRNKDSSKAIYSETYQQGEFRYISSIGGQWVYKVNSLRNKFFLISKAGNVTEINSEPGFRSAIRNELPESITVDAVLTLEPSMPQKGDSFNSYVFDRTTYAKTTDNANDRASLLYLNYARIQSALTAGRTVFVAWYKNGKFTRVKGTLISWTEFDLNPGSPSADKTYCVNSITLKVTKVEKPFIDIPFAERAAKWGSVGKAELYTSNGSICELNYTLFTNTSPGSGGLGYIESELVKQSTFVDNRIFLTPPIMVSTRMKKYAADEYILMLKDGKINVVRKGTIEGRLNIPKNSRIFSISYHP